MSKKDSYIVKSGMKTVNHYGVRVIKDGVKCRSSNAIRRNNLSQSLPRPPSLRVTLRYSEKYRLTQQIVKANQLHTVCEEAKCPNINECWSAGTATLMLMGSVCTRACQFCAVDTGNPKGWLDPNEPQHVARAVQLMGLGYVVLTSVNRDDLADGGAGHYAKCVTAIKPVMPHTKVEALTPDFQGSKKSITCLLATHIDVFAQNIETVTRLTHPIRDKRATYQQTLDVLAFAKQLKPNIFTKTSLMLGLGETDDEILTCMKDLRKHHVDILTLGQYLRPTVNHWPVQRYVSKEQFKCYRQWGLEHGFIEVVAGALVRSSYRAERVFARNNVDLS